MTNVCNSRRLPGAAIILLAGGVGYEAWHHPGTLPPHYPPTDLTTPAADVRTEFVMTNQNYEANGDLWLNPGVPVYATDISYANCVFPSDRRISPMDFDQLAIPASDWNRPAPFLTVVDKDITYPLFSIGNFKATLNLTPTKAKPDDLFPTQLKPGLGGSFGF